MKTQHDPCDFYSEELGDRLRLARETLGRTQKGLSDLLEIGFRSWQDYERGHKTPGSQVLAKLSNFGINGHWLLTGKGPMLMIGSEAWPNTVREEGGTYSTSGLDPVLLAEIMVAVDQVATERPYANKWEAVPKSRLVAKLYRIYAASKEKPDSNDPGFRAMIDVLVGE